MASEYHYTDYYLWPQVGVKWDEGMHRRCSIYGLRTEDNSEMCNTIRDIKWNCWGEKLASLSEDRTIRVYNMQVFKNWQLQPPVALLRASEEIFDWTWHPYHPSLIATTCADLPIQVWTLEDSADGWANRDDCMTLQINEFSEKKNNFNFKLVCTYAKPSGLCRRKQAISLCFSNDGKILVSGYPSAIYIHDISRPETTLKNTKFPGQVSALEFHPFWKFFVAGTFQGRICTIDPHAPEFTQMISIADCPATGVAQMLFAPDGNKLFVSIRRANGIYCWDIRMPNEYMHKLERVSKNGQRIRFDIDKTGHILASGSQQLGVVKVWELEDFKCCDDWIADSEMDAAIGDTIVNSFKFNRKYDMWALSTGTRPSCDFDNYLKSKLLLANY